MEPDQTRRGASGVPFRPFMGHSTTSEDAYRSGIGADDAFVEAVAQRLVQRLSADLANKLTEKKVVASPAQRLALAIISLVALLGLTGIAMGVSAALHELWIGLVLMLFICIAICIINAVYNISGRS